MADCNATRLTGTLFAEIDALGLCRIGTLSLSTRKRGKLTDIRGKIGWTKTGTPRLAAAASVTRKVKEGLYGIRECRAGVVCVDAVVLLNISGNTASTVTRSGTGWGDWAFVTNTAAFHAGANKRPDPRAGRWKNPSGRPVTSQYQRCARTKRCTVGSICSSGPRQWSLEGHLRSQSEPTSAPKRSCASARRLVSKTIWRVI